MSAQHVLALPVPAASNTVVINARCSLRIEADQRVIVVAGLPVHHYRAEDALAAAYAMVLLVGRLCPTNGGGTSVCPIGAQRAAVSTPLCARWDGSTRARGGLAPRSPAYRRQTSAQYRRAEERGAEQSSDRAPAGGNRECDPQADSFAAYHEHKNAHARS